MPMELVNRLPYDHPYRWDARVFGGPQLWRPSNLGSELALWLDAEDAASITLNGTTVSQWQDKSGNGRHASQGTVTRQPLYDSTGLGGRPIIKCDGVDDNLLANAAAAAFGSNNFVFFLVVRFPVTGAHMAILRESGGPLMRGYLSRSGTAGFLSSWGDPTVTTPTITGVANVRNVISVVRTGNSVQAFCNGTPSAIVNPTFNNSYSTLTLGSFDPTSQFSDTWFSEIVGAVGTFSLATVQLLEGYLAWKWGLDANLPAGHPFRNTPPTV